MNSIIFLVLVFSLLPGFLYAYLDGGFLSMILQFFVAFVASGRSCVDGRRLIRVAFGCAPSVCACAAHLSIALAGFHKPKPAQRDGVTASYSIDVFVLYSPAGGFS